MNTDNIIALFCDVDDFCLKFEPEFNKKLIEDGHKKRNRESTLCLSEVMTITICFHMSAYRTFKDYYTQEVSNHMRWAFPRLLITFLLIYCAECSPTFLVGDFKN